MGKLVRQNLFQLPGVIERPPHRDSNFAVKDTTRPRRASRNITELFISIQDDSNDPRWVSQQWTTDAPVPCVQAIDCSSCQPLRRSRFTPNPIISAQLFLT